MGECPKQVCPLIGIQQPRVSHGAQGEEDGTFWRRLDNFGKFLRGQSKDGFLAKY
jgi:hypothetical protein